MKIRTWHLQRLTLPLASPLRTSRGTFHTREGALLILEGEGHYGMGEAMPLEAFGTEPVDVSVRGLVDAAEWLLGRTLPEDVPALERVVDTCPNLAQTPAARHAVESALLDLLGRVRGVPAARLLRPDARGAIRVNAILDAVAPEALATEAAKAVADGFQVVKVKVAGRPLAEDAKRLEAVRRAVGDDVRIRIDANGAWTADDAREALTTLGAFGLEACEQPVSPESIRALASLRGEVPCLIAVDESVSTVAAARALCRSGGVDALVLRPMVLGGLLPVLRAAEEAHAHGVRTWVASSLEGPVGRAAAAQVAAALPDDALAHGLATGALFAAEHNVGGYPVAAGAIKLPEAAGMGIDRRAR